MTFVIRQISKTSDGREIVRAATLEKSQISIGRDSQSDVHLPDLAVELEHALITLLSGGNLRVEAVAGLPFTADGRKVTNIDINPAVGASLRFGGHQIDVTSDDGRALLTVQRTEALSDSVEEREVSKLYTLGNVLPSRRAAAWTFIAAVLALFLAWPIYTYATSQGVKDRPAGFHADSMWTSGDLSLSHKSLEDNCQACHVNKFEAVTDKACLTCHKDDAHEHAAMDRLARAEAAPGIGGTIKAGFQSAFGIPQGRCVECHTEHEGAGAMEPTAQKFCADCHGSLDARLTDTKLANAADFGTEHPTFKLAVTTDAADPHRAVMRKPQTASLTEDNGLKFPHDIHLSKNNGIARMAQTMATEQGWGQSLECKDCHVKTADGTRFQPVDMEKDCGMCHSLAFDQIGGTIRTLRHGQPAQVAADLRAFYRSTQPARPINLGGMVRRRPGDYSALETAGDYILGARAWPGRADEAIRAVFSKGGACYDCHVVNQTGGGFNVQKVHQPSRYMMKGWFDHEAHQQETCASCHKADTSKAATDLLLPDLKSCRTCHVGESGAALTSVKKPVESGCAMCHDYHIGKDAPWRSKVETNKAMGKPRFGAPSAGGSK